VNAIPSHVTRSKLVLASHNSLKEIALPSHGALFGALAITL
ncbi:MAG: hypothetical protein QOI17_1345, partial [Gaiellales bacterium]|nr:hypothetical protein [Gaiellales bacterium]